MDYDILARSQKLKSKHLNYNFVSYKHAAFDHTHTRTCNIYIYMYAFSRRFYPKRLTVNSGYTFFCQYVFPGNQTHNLCAATEPQLSHRNIYIYMLSCGSVVEHCVVGLIPREHILTKNCIAWIHCKSLWIKASAKCIHVNVYIYIYIHRADPPYTQNTHSA